MLIQQRSVRSIDRYVRGLLPGEVIRVVTPLGERDLTSLGFSSCPDIGDTILPTIVGTVSRFNAEGKELVRKDLPKEPRYITTLEWTWEQWCGGGNTETVTENRDIFRDCYPREQVPPPSEELTRLQAVDGPVIASREFHLSEPDLSQLKHVVNLFLELFGQCEIRRADLTQFMPMTLKRVNWHLLPPGEYPFERVKRHTEELVAGKDARYGNVILNRQAFITKYNPDQTFEGSWFV